MCGIAGYWGHGSREILEKMLRKISHRGPDDSGLFVNGNIGLGSNRLSIIDLSRRGRQPIFNREKSACIVFNGEIYNFMDVKKTLGNKYPFSSKTDTEVVLHAYEEWGTNCLSRLNGMFAFVIYDLKKNLLFGARDRLGEKPLKYFFQNESFAFASEIKALLPYMGKKPEIDYEAINHYLTLQYVPGTKTGFKKIYKLPPGSYFIFKDGHLRIERYWDLSFKKKETLGEGEWAKLILGQVEEAVKSRMTSDVPIGALLSGGVDSSTVVAFMARNSRKRIKTFSIGFDDPKFDETYYAQLVASKYKTDHHVLRVEASSMADSLDETVSSFDEPIADNSILPTFLLSKLVSKHIKVALNGDGGDENFAGYKRYNIVEFSRIYEQIPKTLRKDVIRPFSDVLFNVFKTKFASRVSRFCNTFEEPFFRRYLNYSCFFTNPKKNSILSSDFKKRVTGDTFEIYKSLYNPALSDLDNALNFDIHSYLPDLLLYKTDTASMANSLEVRAPLLDYKLMETTSLIQPNLKLKNQTNKYIFKKALSQSGLLPPEILQRGGKQGFIAPIDKWFKNDLRGFVRDQVSSQKMRQSGIFSPRKLEAYVDRYFSSNLGYANNIFALISLSIWLQSYA